MLSHRCIGLTTALFVFVGPAAAETVRFKGPQTASLSISVNGNEVEVKGGSVLSGGSGVIDVDGRFEVFIGGFENQIHAAMTKGGILTGNYKDGVFSNVTFKQNCNAYYCEAISLNPR